MTVLVDPVNIWLRIKHKLQINLVTHMVLIMLLKHQVNLWLMIDLGAQKCFKLMIGLLGLSSLS